MKSLRACNIVIKSTPHFGRRRTFHGKEFHEWLGHGFAQYTSEYPAKTVKEIFIRSSETLPSCMSIDHHSRCLNSSWALVDLDCSIITCGKPVRGKRISPHYIQRRWHLPEHKSRMARHKYSVPWSTQSWRVSVPADDFDRATGMYYVR